MKSIFTISFTICSLVSSQIWEPIPQTNGNANPQPIQTQPIQTQPPLPSLSISGGSSHSCLMTFNTPPTFGGCSNAAIDFGSIDEFFQMSCSALGACAGSTMTFNVDVERIDKFECTAQFGCYKTDVIINGGSQNGVKVDYMKCDGPGACQDMNIYLNNADIGKFVCTIGSCQGCAIWQNGIAKACAGW